MKARSGVFDDGEASKDLLDVVRIGFRAWHNPELQIERGENRQDGFQFRGRITCFDQENGTVSLRIELSDEVPADGIEVGWQTGGRTVRSGAIIPHRRCPRTGK